MPRPEFISRANNFARAAGLDVKVLPTVAELMNGVDHTDVRDLAPEDLLGRHQVDTAMDSIAGYLQGKRVLVAGAGGSIGSELCRQINGFAPSELMMLDCNEDALHSLALSLSGRADLESPNLILANIRDPEQLQQIFDTRRPQIVFHAAALKHVNILQTHAAEAVKTNVIGTLNVLEAARSADVQRFVNISTDKAADPESVLGHSKRIAEGLTKSYATISTGTYLSVRFGNVLGTSGSVLRTFRAQIDRGGPVTVTHPDVTRYFMTVHEAVQLVVQAAVIGRDGEALVLDMGKPVRIVDLAHQLIDRAGQPIDIVFTGLKPGEKLHENLLGAGEVDERPIHSLVSQCFRTTDLPSRSKFVANGDRQQGQRGSNGCAVVTYARLHASRGETLNRIHLSSPDIGALEEEFVVDAVRSGWVAPLGPHVDAFEAGSRQPGSVSNTVSPSASAPRRFISHSSPGELGPVTS